RKREPERLRRLRVDNQLDLGGLQCGQARRFLAFQDTSGVDACHVSPPPIAHQSAGKRRRATEQRHRSAPLHAPAHSITWSAMACNVSDGVRPRAWAVFRLMTSSNLVGTSTGRSTVFAPRRMRSTYVAVRRNMSRVSAP